MPSSDIFGQPYSSHTEATHDIFFLLPGMIIKSKHNLLYSEYVVNITLDLSHVTLPSLQSILWIATVPILQGRDLRLREEN